MRISYNWLKEFIDLKITAKETAEALNSAGIEVAGIEKRGGVGLDNIVVGRVEKIESHPNADRLVLCDVNVGEKSLKIVCGARNMSAGDCCPVALPGAVISDGTKISVSKIRGQSSEGMLCSEVELGLAKESAGIMILSGNVNPGDNMKKHLGEADSVIKIELSPNRPDCLSVLGVARELSALLDVPYRKPVFEFVESGKPVVGYVSVETVEKDLCPRYCARVVENVKLGESPGWLVDRLIKCGFRPINNVVDVTNYVLLELGHPLHAFDLNKLRGGKIIVRRARDGEKITTIDGVERELNADNLVIADADRPVAIAGVMGGKNTEVDGATRNILLESAYFNHISVRRTSKHLGISTEASYRFERGTDIEGLVSALDRTAELISKICGGVIAKGMIDAYQRFNYSENFDRAIQLRVDRVNRVLGTEISKEETAVILKRLHLKSVEKETAFTVFVPTYRHDIYREIDVIEEIARIYGYNRIPSGPVVSAIEVPGRDEFKVLRDKLRTVSADRGFYEIYTYSFVKQDYDNEFYGTLERDPVKLANPLTENFAVMRRGLVPGILETVRYNLNRGQEEIAVFEIGKCFFGNGAGHPIEKNFYTAGLCSRQASKEEEFLKLKGFFESVMSSVGIERNDIKYEKYGADFLDGIYSAEIFVEGSRVGFIGTVKQGIADKYFGVEKPVFIFETNLDGLPGIISNVKSRYRRIPRFPQSARDISVVVKNEATVQEIIAAIRDSSEYVKEASFFDLYRGEKIGNGLKSVSFSIKFGADDRTLTDEEINTVFNGIVKSLAEKFGAELRKE